ncbi:MAG: linear amide C-N hydrolase [Erysipelothrix sp.]|nr:linear amide C-N hydrolase [Erysipelothrix sp.]
MHILNAVDIPKGSIVTQRHTIDYTQYTSYMVNNDQSYLYRMHDSLNVVGLKLSDFDLDSDTIKIVDFPE